MLKNILSAVDDLIFDLTIIRSQLLAIATHSNKKNKMKDLLKRFRLASELLANTYNAMYSDCAKLQNYIVFDKEEGNCDIYRGLNLNSFGKRLRRFVPLNKNVLATLALLDSIGVYTGKVMPVAKKQLYVHDNGYSPGTYLLVSHNGNHEEIISEIIKKRDEIPARIRLSIMPKYIRITYGIKRTIAISGLLTKSKKPKVITF